MLCRAAILLMELKALLVSMSRAASVSSSKNASQTEWTAASQPESWPAQSWMEPAASSTSPPTTTTTVFVMMHLAVSPMPMGRIPGHLSRAISLQARSGPRLSGSTREGESRFATSARDWYRDLEAALKAVQILRHAWVSRPDGPAAPLVLSAMERMRRAAMLSKTTGGTSGGGSSREKSGEAGWLVGCLLARASLTVLESGSFGFAG